MKKSIIIFLSAISLQACASTIPQNTETQTYIAGSNSCKEILYTCPQFQVPFMNDQGCGCEQSDAPDNPDSRSYQSLIPKYLANFVDVPGKNEATIVDFMNMNAVESDNGKKLLIEVWAMIRKYKLSDNEPQFISETNNPVIIEVEQRGNQYVFHGHSVVDYTRPSSLRKLSQETQNYIQSANFTENKKEIDRILGESLDAQFEVLREL